MAAQKHLWIHMSWLQMEGRAYWIALAAVFLAVAIWESCQPKRPLRMRVERRWSRYAILLLACTVISTLVFRVTPVLVAVRVADSWWGILNKSWAPFSIRCTLAIVTLDLLRYTLHRAFHAVPFLWNIHQVHHADPDFDLTTGARVHPLEVLLLQGFTLAAVALLAPPPVAVLIVEVAFCCQSFFGHANASLPEWIETPLRWVYITPDMHRVHHSELVDEQCKNLGDIFPWWDRLLGTYLAEPAAGQDGIVIGLQGMQSERSVDLGFMLMQPFRPAPAGDSFETDSGSAAAP